MKTSYQFGVYHSLHFYPKGCTSKKFALSVFVKESTNAHLVGRACSLQKIIKEHERTPYNNIDEIIGDMQAEVIKLLNEFKKNSLAKMPWVTFENMFKDN